MSLRLLASGLLGLLVSVVAADGMSARARAADTPPTGAGVSAPEADGEARSLFSQGQIHYSLGEYAQAIADFRRAYELTSAPGLLFNIAQTYRLNGECKRALEVYRHFTRLAPESPYRVEADTQIAALEPRCGGPAQSTPAPVPGPRIAAAAATPPADALVLRTPSRADIAAKPAPRSSAPRRTAAVLLGGGVAVGLAAGAVAWWNGGRYDDWQKEDKRLAAGPTPGTQGSVWLADQQRNDGLLQSVQTADKVDFVLAALAVAAVLASAITLVVYDR